MNSIDKPYTLHAAEEPTQVHSREACTMADLDAIRFEVARADVMAIVAHEHFDRTIWREADGERVDFVGHLIAATMEAASAALLAVDDLRRAVASRRAVPGAEIWTDG
ncbi:MAG TPA: hypothetical protein VHN14_36655 [Kofleriaceae bacterium]|jgi:hypothetical protein|nr:hypothetical protein [Kofleriaceae bacterium]